MQNLPLEVKPLIDALNQLFEHTLRERRFTSDVAHELRSPLAALKVQAEVAQLAEDDAPARSQALQHLHQGIDRAARLVEQLLTLSRLDSLTTLSDIAPITLQPLLQQAVADAWHSAQRGGIDIRLDMQGEPVTGWNCQLCNVSPPFTGCTPAMTTVKTAVSRSALPGEPQGTNNYC